MSNVIKLPGKARRHKNSHAATKQMAENATITPFPSKKSAPEEMSITSDMPSKEWMLMKAREIVQKQLQEREDARRVNIERTIECVRRMLNGEPMSQRQQQRLSRLVTNGLYFMLYERDALMRQHQIKMSTLKRLGGNPFQMKTTK